MTPTASIHKQGNRYQVRLDGDLITSHPDLNSAKHFVSIMLIHCDVTWDKTSKDRWEATVVDTQDPMPTNGLRLESDGLGTPNPRRATTKRAAR
jgi:hypothetical protein